MNRREFIQRTGLLAGGLALGVHYREGLNNISRHTANIDSPTPIDKPTSTFLVPEIPPLPIISTEEKIPSLEDWNSARLQNILEQAIKTSVERNQKIVVDLPFGEIKVDKKIKIEIPKDANIVLQGNSKGSVLKLDEYLSILPPEWGSRNRNLLEILTEGNLSISGVVFDGGSRRAGKGGYRTPPSPWDSILLIAGKGPGADLEPDHIIEEQRKGKVEITNCKFVNSESAGVVTQNLGEVIFQDNQGKNLDAIWVVNWCDQFFGRNIVAENLLSDGIFVVDALNGEIRDCVVKTARQGYDFQGARNVQLVNCHSIDCAEGFTFTKSPTSTKRRLENFLIENCNSSGCAIVYAVGHSTNVKINNCRHDLAGEWFKFNDFMHMGIANAGGPREVNSAIALWEESENVTFTDVQIRKSKGAPSGYRVPSLAGIETFEA